MNIEDDRFTRILTRCIGLRMMGKLMTVNDFGGQGGSSTPDPAFSGLYSLSLNPFSFNNLIRQDGRFIVTIL